MKRGKRKQDQSPLDELFDDPDSLPSYNYRDEEAERLIAKFEREIQADDYDDLGWGIYKSY